MSKTIFEKSIPGRKGYTLPKNEINLKIENYLPEKFIRKEEIRLPQVSELDMMRHFIELSGKNHCIEKGFYPLGSCTMKYNPKINETLVSNPEFSQIHPFQSEKTVQGALEILYELQ
ncbi:MAG: aminomethyl-transferring glycine dehydrogenase subunit GcvPB, partial [Candidatus Cloacimonadota bacterium]